MHVFTRAAGFAAVWLFVFACSNGAPNSTTTSATGTGSMGAGGDAARAILTTFCSTVAPTFCDAYYACCSSPTFVFGGNPMDVNEAINGPKTCKEWVRDGSAYTVCNTANDEQDPSGIVNSLRAGTIVFDQAQFDTCLATLKSMTAGGAACVEPPAHVLNTTCRSAFRGQIALGDACPFEGDVFEPIWEDSVLPCKEGRCEYGKCVPFLKTGDACDLRIDQLQLFSEPAAMLCNFPEKEVCWGDPGAGGAGGGGDAGSAGAMGTCRPQAELGEACNPANHHECKSHHCDVTGKCVLPDPWPSGCKAY